MKWVFFLFPILVSCQTEVVKKEGASSQSVAPPPQEIERMVEVTPWPEKDKNPNSPSSANVVKKPRRLPILEDTEGVCWTSSY